MAIFVHLSDGVRWELPEGTDTRALTEAIKSAMENGSVYEYRAEAGPDGAQVLLFNGGVLDFVAITDGPLAKGHPARG